VCDLVKAAQCDGVAKCTEVAVGQIDLPAVVHVDFAGSKLTAPDDPRTSPIKAVEAVEAVEAFDAVLVLQGHQNGRGWTMVIERATGHL
jgi:hypothetical protein